MAIIDRVKELLSLDDDNRKIKELESLCETLSLENEQLKKAGKHDEAYEQRIASLEAVLKKMLDMFSRSWSGREEQLVMRTCRAILEDDESWRKNL